MSKVSQPTKVETKYTHRVLSYMHKPFKNTEVPHHRLVTVLCHSLFYCYEIKMDPCHFPHPALQHASDLQTVSAIASLCVCVLKADTCLKGTCSQFPPRMTVFRLKMSLCVSARQDRQTKSTANSWKMWVHFPLTIQGHMKVWGFLLRYHYYTWGYAERMSSSHFYVESQL